MAIGLIASGLPRYTKLSLQQLHYFCYLNGISSVYICLWSSAADQIHVNEIKREIPFANVFFWMNPE